MADNQNKVCVITGATRGIGSATARLAARRGYAVCVNYLHAAAEAAALVSDIERAGGSAIAHQADVSREEEVAGLFRAVDKALGPVTALVNNAAIPGDRRAFLDVDTQLLNSVLCVNFTGTFFCTQEAAKRMAVSRGGRGGAVVNLSSAVTRTGGYKLSPYVASKGAVEGLTIALAHELGAEGIRVNCVCPGIIATERNLQADAEHTQRRVATIPAGRLGSSQEVATALLWLVSDEASYVTGAVLPITGGW